ncbi:MAG: monofunctional biosynthetic peptidoglycan transglycosylase [Pseudomonadota bacterium]
MWKRFFRFLKIPVLILAVAFVGYELWVAACVAWWVKYDPRTSAFMEDRLEILQEKNPRTELRQRWVPYSKISSYLKRAVIASEDATFTRHDGFDWTALEKALNKNLKKGRIVAGGSTLSQQLAKNLFLSGQRTVWRKAQEAYITVLIEWLMDKRRILEIYLNIIEWGDGVFGAEAAARHYFGVSAAALDPQQAARLAAMIPNPRYYDRRRQTGYLQYRTRVILARMPGAVIPR